MKRATANVLLNPYIAMTDVMVNLVLIFAFFLLASAAVGRVGWEQVRYRDAQAAFQQAVERAIPDQEFRPMLRRANDPPGVQRWVFSQRALFDPSGKLTGEGRALLLTFVQILRDFNKASSPSPGPATSDSSYPAFRWRRIRIEGHTKPPPNSTSNDDWTISSERAAEVAKVFAGAGHVPSHFIAVAARAGQDPINKDVPGSAENERVEIVVEYR